MKIHLSTLAWILLVTLLALPVQAAGGGPGLRYSTYLGGTGDDKVNDVALGSDGSIYVTGYTYSDQFGSGSLSQSSPDVFVAKLSADGQTLAYFKRFGGGGEDVGNAIAVDGTGQAYVTGFTQGGSFPHTTNAFDTTFNGGADNEADAFITQLDPDGDIVYSSFLGGSGYDVPGSDRMGGVDIGYDIVFDGTYVYVTGLTESDDFPTTGGAYDTTYANVDYGLTQDLFIVKLRPAAQGANDLAYGTFVGGGIGSETGRSITVDTDGAIYVGGTVTGGSGEFPLTSGAIDTDISGGWDTFLLKMHPGGQGTNDLTYATYLGGSQTEDVHALVVDNTGTVYLTGETGSPDFPTTAGAFDTICGTDNNCNYVPGWGHYADVFITRINPDPSGTAQSNLLYSTFLGGADYENQMGNGDLALIAPGEIYVSGSTRSPDTFPTTPDAFARQRTGTSSDAFVVRLQLNGSGADDLIYGTYVGGNDVDGANAIAWNGGNVVTVAGETWNTALSGDFPTTSDALYPDHSGGGTYNYDGFLFQLQAPPPLPDLSPSTKRVTPKEATAGEIVTYTIRLVNSGEISATVAVTDTLPATLIPRGAPTASSGPDPIFAGQTLTWAGSVLADTPTTLIYTAELTSTTTLTPTVINAAQIDDGLGNVYVRRAFVNGNHIFLPLVLRSH